MSKLARKVGLPGAVMMGLGSIVGTGVFVSVGIGAGLAGPAVILSLLLAGGLAFCNGMSSAQLAAAHPVSGGTYAYGNKYLHPWAGFAAGWLFTCAKSASAATAAIGFGGYFAHLFQVEHLQAWQLGLVAVVALTLVCLMGITRSNQANTVIVGITLITLLSFTLFLLGDVRADHFRPFLGVGEERRGLTSFLEATALMFVAYTGYGRIATLGEEIIDPVKNIPKAILATLFVSFFLYMSVGIIAVGVAGALQFYEATVDQAAPLEVIAELAGKPTLAKILALGAMTAMLGVLLNLVLGVSRVVFAMGEQKDLPAPLGQVNAKKTPGNAILFTGLVMFFLVLLKDVKSTWSFSAFTVLGYYAITNLCALKLPEKDRLYPRIFSWLGLAGCLFLAFWVDQQALLLGIGLLACGVPAKLFFNR